MLTSRLLSSCPAPKSQFANSYHTGNTCTSADGDFYSFSGCSANPNNLNSTVYRSEHALYLRTSPPMQCWASLYRLPRAAGNNTLLADVGSTFSITCNQTLSFAQWQALDQDVGSSTGITPSVPELIDLGATVLGVQ